MAFLLSVNVTVMQQGVMFTVCPKLLLLMMHFHIRLKISFCTSRVNEQQYREDHVGVLRSRHSMLSCSFFRHLLVIGHISTIL